MSASHEPRLQKEKMVVRLTESRKYLHDLSFFKLATNLSFTYRNPQQYQDQEREAEETAQVLESFVDGASPNDTHSYEALHSYTASVAPDLPNKYWVNDDVRRHNERLNLIREIVSSLPELETIRALYNIFTTRCQGALGNVVHTSTFLDEADKFYSCLRLDGVEPRVVAISRVVSMDALGGYLMAVRISHVSTC